MKREWTVTDGMGNTHHIMYKNNGFGAKYMVDDDTYKCKSKNWFVMLADVQISMPGAECNLVVIGNSIRLAVNGVYIDDNTPYEPVRNMPSWVKVMIVVSAVVGFIGAKYLGLVLSVFADMFAIQASLKGKNGVAIGWFVGFIALIVVWIIVQFAILF